METQTKSLRVACGSITLLGFGLVLVLYGWYSSGLAASSDFPPVRAIYSRMAASMFLTGVPMLLMGCFLLIKYSQSGSGNMVFQHETFMPRSVPAAASESKKVACPKCGFLQDPTLGIVRPDGSVICTKCFERFIPTA